MRVGVCLGTLVVMLSLASCRYIAGSTDRVFLVPRGYLGPVVVLYGDDRGVRDLARDGSGRRVFDVPRDGVLRLREQGPDILVGPVGYFWKDAGRVVGDIPRGREIPKTAIQVFGESYGVLPGPSRRVVIPGSDAAAWEQSTSSPGSIRYEFFVVGVPSSSRDWRQEQDFLGRAAGRE